jgi:hypothetical protein
MLLQPVSPGAPKPHLSPHELKLSLQRLHFITDDAGVRTTIVIHIHSLCGVTVSVVAAIVIHIHLGLIARRKRLRRFFRLQLHLGNERVFTLHSRIVLFFRSLGGGGGDVGGGVGGGGGCFVATFLCRVRRVVGFVGFLLSSCSVVFSVGLGEERK